MAKSGTSFSSNLTHEESKHEVKTVSLFPLEEDPRLLVLKPEIERQLAELKKSLKDMPAQYQQPGAIDILAADRDTIKAQLIHAVLALETDGISASKLQRATTLLDIYVKPFSSTKICATAIIEFAKNELASRNQPGTAEEYRWLKIYVMDLYPASFYQMQLEQFRNFDDDLTLMKNTLIRVKGMSSKAAQELIDMCNYMKICLENERNQDTDQVQESLLALELSIHRVATLYNNSNIIEVGDILTRCELTHRELVKLDQDSRTKIVDDTFMKSALDGEQKFEYSLSEEKMEFFIRSLAEAEDKLNVMTPTQSIFSSSQSSEKILLIYSARNLLTELKKEFARYETTEGSHILFSAAQDWKSFKEVFDKLICATAIYKQKNNGKHGATSYFIQHDIINLGVNIINAIVKNQQMGPRQESEIREIRIKTRAITNS